jgi:hypothetical protein
VIRAGTRKYLAPQFIVEFGGKKMRTVVVILAVVFGFAGQVQARALSIYEIQYTTDVNGISPQNSQIIDCLGGIVTFKRAGGRPRMTIQDPSFPYGWGGIQVKDFIGDAFNEVAIGDWVSLSNVLVEEYRGTTYLQFISDNNPSLSIVSTNNSLPKPLVISVDEITAPVEGIDSWAVTNHNAEKYESMMIKVVSVSVKGIGYGKAYDNYILSSNDEPNSVCWISDYMNYDINGIYLPFVEVGNTFCGVTGFLEQYVGESDGIYYDYYQLLTTKTDDFLILQQADFDGDCDVDFEDLAIFMGYWMQSDCAVSDNCGGADMAPEQPDGVVDILDLMEFIQYLNGSKN